MPVLTLFVLFSAITIHVIISLLKVKTQSRFQREMAIRDRQIERRIKENDEYDKAS